MAIACDICGGTLSMDASGEFALCDSCGMKYTKDRIKAMMQKVASPVAVSNIAGFESLMKRGNLALEDSDWRNASNYFDKVLDINAEYAPAYIGKLCSELNFTNEAMLSKRLLLASYPNYQKALRFAKEEYLTRIKNYDRFSREFFITKKQRFENIQKQMTKKEQVAILPQYGIVSVSGKGHTITLAADGSVKGDGCQMELRPAKWTIPGGNFTAGHTTYGYEILYEYKHYKKGEFIDKGSSTDWFEKNKFEKNKNVIAIATSDYHIVLLRLNETAIAYGRNGHGQCNTENWNNIVAISAGDEFSIGLKDDGTVVAAGNYPRNIILWKDIVMIYASGKYVVGLKSDDTFVAAGQDFDISGSDEQIIAKLQVEEREWTEQQERKEKEKREFLEKQRIKQEQEREREEKEKRESLEKQHIEWAMEKKKKIFWIIFRLVVGGIIGGFAFAGLTNLENSDLDKLVKVFAIVGFISGLFTKRRLGDIMEGCITRPFFATIYAIVGAIIGVIIKTLLQTIPFISFIGIGVSVGALIGYWIGAFIGDWMRWRR